VARFHPFFRPLKLIFGCPPQRGLTGQWLLPDYLEKHLSNLSQPRMKNFSRLQYSSLLIFCLFVWQSCSQAKRDASTAEPSSEFYNIDDFATVEKFDTHIHLNTDAPAFIHQAADDHFRFLDIVDDRPFGLPMEEQEAIAQKQVKAFPGRVVYATTFSVKNWSSEQWQQETIGHLKDAVSHGAVAVKVWKNVGMSLRDKDGKFVMIDHPRFDSLLNFLAKNKITLIGHLGEPKDCWLPLDKMTMKGNRAYYAEHPDYHMYLHPEYPSYDDQIAARDHMLEKHPDLIFIGAHLGSLEWSLDELAKRLDRFPNMAVDLARMPNLQHHALTDWQKTHDFFVRYQDRLLYATDRQVNADQDSVEMKTLVHEARLRDWQFFTTNDKMTSNGFEGEFKGLKLPRTVIDKLYFKNASKWLLRTEVR
jgi:hypothetical protein